MGYIIVGPLKSRDDIGIPEVRIAGGGEEDDSREKGLNPAEWSVMRGF